MTLDISAVAKAQLAREHGAYEAEREGLGERFLLEMEVNRPGKSGD